MRAEKQNLTQEYLKRLNASPFFIVVNYQGLKVGPITELRKRLGRGGAEIHVVKNSLFRIAAKEAGVADLNGGLSGQVKASEIPSSWSFAARLAGPGTVLFLPWHEYFAAPFTGQRDVSAAAKVVKNFNAEFDKLKIKFGYLNNNRLEASDLIALADLPSIEVLRGKLLGVLQAPATK